MSNSYFQFKQFIVEQDHCAMKVCTDSCILGAWFAERISSCSLVLDLGSGSGLLMLMLAQKNKAEIHGIEIDLPALNQLKENISRSRWQERLNAFPGDARFYSYPAKYDFIISNPPFFDNELLSKSYDKNIAKHGLELSYEDLLRIIEANLRPMGSFGVLLPYGRADYFEKLANQCQFFLTEKLFLRQTPGHAPFRAILHFSRNKVKFIPDTLLTIKNDHAEYTNEFAELLKDYYLNL
jgi:tRNA1Val (adenine37-N6)-methyltransferase